MMKYAGLTHALPMWLLPLWKRIMCRRSCHVFDEVENSEGQHFLVCDACQITVHIACIEWAKPRSPWF